MTNMLLRTARQQQGWSQQQLADFAGVSLSTIERAERGEPIRVDNLERLCSCLQKAPEQLGLIKDYEVNRRQANKTIAGLVSGLFLASSTGRIDLPPLAELWADGLLTIHARGIAACQDLYYNGNPYQVEAILPLYNPIKPHCLPNRRAHCNNQRLDSLPKLTNLPVNSLLTVKTLGQHGKQVSRHSHTLNLQAIATYKSQH